MYLSKLRLRPNFLYFYISSVRCSITKNILLEKSNIPCALSFGVVLLRPNKSWFKY